MKQFIKDSLLGAAIMALLIVGTAAAATNIGWLLGTNNQGQAIASLGVNVPIGIPMNPDYISSAVATTTAGSLATSSIKTYTFSNVASGALATSSVPLTYYFEVSGVDQNGGTSLPSSELSTGLANNGASSTNEIVVNWASLAGAVSYDLYIGTSTGSESLMATTTATSFTLSTTTATSSTGISLATPPTVNTGYVDVINPNGSSWIGGNIYVYHLNGGASASVATGTAAGSSATDTVNYANDVSGAIIVHTGTTTSANAAILKIIFAGSYPKAPACDFQGENSTTASLATAATPFPLNYATSVVLEANTTALGTSTLYQWGYQCSN